MSVLAISGSLVELPTGGVAKYFAENISLARPAEKRTIILGDDAPFSVNLDGAAEVHAIHIESDTKITAKITSADGASQCVPVDPLLTIVSRSVPITAIDLVRVAGQSATVEITLGQKN